MKELYISDLKPGMLTAKPVQTRNGQVLLSENVKLTEQQIKHLEYFKVISVYVKTVPAQTEPGASLESNIFAFQPELRSNIEYKHFQKTFNENVEFLREYINDIILKNDKSNGLVMLEQVTDLLFSIENKVRIFDILRCIRKVDASTYAHSINVAIICRLMGQWLDLSKEDIDILTLCGLLHDVGKCKTPREVLKKPGKLTAEEYAIIKRHSLDGYQILKSLPLDIRIKRAALMHHECCDGSGYPLGLTKDAIDPFAVIVSIADVYDAMTSKRCYRDAICPFEVIQTFEREGFHKYNTTYVNTFLNHIVDAYMHDHVSLNDGRRGQIVWKNKEQLARPTIYLPTREFIDLSIHPELSIQSVIM